MFSRSEFGDSPKRGLLDSPSPTREQKARQAVAEAAASAGTSKWKMQIGPGTSGNSRFKKKQPDRQHQPPPPPANEWQDDLHDKRLNKNGSDYDESSIKKSLPPLPPQEKGVSVRKQMAMKEPALIKKPESPKKPKMLPPAPPPKPLVNTGQVVLDKFGNFRLMTPPELKKGGHGDLPPLPPGAPKGLTPGKAQSYIQCLLVERESGKLFVFF